MKYILYFLLLFPTTLLAQQEENNATHNINRKEMQDIVLWMLANNNDGKDYAVIDQFAPHQSNNKILKGMAHGKIYINSYEIAEEVNPRTGQVVRYYIPKDSMVVDKSEYNMMQLLLSDTFYWNQVLPNPEMLMSYNEYRMKSDSIAKVNNDTTGSNNGFIVFYIVPPVYLKYSMLWYFPKIYKLNGCISCNAVPISLFIYKDEGQWKVYNP